VRCLALVLVGLSLWSGQVPKIVYTKVFPGSGTPYIAISVDRSGSGEFNDSPSGEDPIHFQLKPQETEEIFELAQKLDFFSQPLESGLKVANLGLKTFRYEDGEKRNEVKFNYSRNPAGVVLEDWFDRIATTAQHMIRLDRAAQYDRLGVDRELLLLEVSLDKKRLAGAQMLLPVLDRIANNSSYMNRARERAANIAAILRGERSKQSK